LVMTRSRVQCSLAPPFVQLGKNQFPAVRGYGDDGGFVRQFSIC
jgi:hypothetical protein